MQSREFLVLTHCQCPTGGLQGWFPGKGMCSADATENSPHLTEVSPQALLLLPKSLWGLSSGGNPALPHTEIQPFLLIEGRNYFVGAWLTPGPQLNNSESFKIWFWEEDLKSHLLQHEVLLLTDFWGPRESSQSTIHPPAQNFTAALHKVLASSSPFALSQLSLSSAGCRNCQWHRGERGKCWDFLELGGGQSWFKLEETVPGKCCSAKGGEGKLWSSGQSAGTSDLPSLAEAGARKGFVLSRDFSVYEVGN